MELSEDATSEAPSSCLIVHGEPHTPAGPSRNITKAIGSWELPHGLGARDAAETIWIGILGCHLLSAALGDEPYVRLARNWRVLLTALAPKSELPALNGSLAGMLGRYQLAV